MSDYYKCTTYENDNVFVRVGRYEDTGSITVYEHCPENKDINLGHHFSSKEEALDYYKLIENMIKII